MATWASATSASTSDCVWSMWVDTSNATSATTISSSSDEIWISWTDGTSAGNIIPQSYSPPPETEEQQQARLEREQRFREEREAAQRERETAKCKAEELLRDSLNAEQLEQFDKTEWFFVIGQSGKCYRIRHGWIGNVDELDQDDMVVAEYCIHPQIQVPVEDSMLVQKLMLEADESRFMEIANKTTHRVPVVI